MRTLMRYRSQTLPTLRVCAIRLNTASLAYYALKEE